MRRSFSSVFVVNRRSESFRRSVRKAATDDARVRTFACARSFSFSEIVLDRDLIDLAGLVVGNFAAVEALREETISLFRSRLKEREITLGDFSDRIPARRDEAVERFDGVSVKIRRPLINEYPALDRRMTVGGAEETVRLIVATPEPAKLRSDRRERLRRRFFPIVQTFHRHIAPVSLAPAPQVRGRPK